MNWNPDEIIAQQIILLKNHIWSYIIWYDFYELFKVIMKSIENAYCILTKSWKPSANLAQHRQEMDHILRFANLVINPNILKLDFVDVPTCIRSRIVEDLGQFNKLNTLILRSHGKTNGQWLFKSVAEDLMFGEFY